MWLFPCFVRVTSKYLISKYKHSKQYVNVLLWAYIYIPIVQLDIFLYYLFLVMIVQCIGFTIHQIANSQ